MFVVQGSAHVWELQVHTAITNKQAVWEGPTVFSDWTVDWPQKTFKLHTRRHSEKAFPF